MITGLYFYSNFSVIPPSRENRRFIERKKRSLAPQWLLKFHHSSPPSVTYINYWSYSCHPCLAELPFLVKLQREGFKDKYKVLLFNVDQEIEEIKKAKDYLLTTFPEAQSIYSHLSAWNELKKVGSLPYHQVIDKNGNVAMELIGEANPAMQQYIKDGIQILLQESKF